MSGTIKDYTPNFNLIIPEFNISGWHDYLEENFRSIDALFYNIFDIQNYKGQWQRLTTYTVDDVVFISDATDTSFSGRMYKVLVNHTTTNEPFDEFYEDNPTYYERFMDASSAQQYANYCKLYAEGTDVEVSPLGITHSCKKWNELCESLVETLIAKQYAADLSLIGNKLQLKDENGNLIGTAITLSGGIVQLQSDWNQNDNTSPDYIKNKPTISTVNNATIIIKDDTTTIGSFTTNQSTNSAIDLQYLTSFVKIAGTQTITGDKTFNGTVTVTTPALSDDSTKPVTTAYINDKFVVVNVLPVSPDPDTFYYIPESV